MFYYIFSETNKLLFVLFIFNFMSDSNLSEEANQELEVLLSIYPDDITLLPNGRLVYRLPYNTDWSVHLSLSSKYPELEAPNILMVDSSGPESKLQNKFKLNFLLEKCSILMNESYIEGMECLYDYTFNLNENWDSYLQEWEDSESNEKNDISNIDDEITAIEEKLQKINLKIQNDEPLQGWIQSEPIDDRGSIFVAYAYSTDNEEEALMRLNHLKTDNRISRSRHVMYAYRFNSENKGRIVSDCDDDGETAAGSRMLHLLTLMDAQNVIVACARWFTGTHIGPDRFKHINSATRDVIIKGNFSKKEAAAKANESTKKKKK